MVIVRRTSEGRTSYLVDDFKLHHSKNRAIKIIACEAGGIVNARR